MGRKNTAEAFEILLEMAEEVKRKRRAEAAAAGPPVPAPAPGAGASSPQGLPGRVVGLPVSPLAAPLPRMAGSGLRRDPLLRAPAPALGSSRRPAAPAPVLAPAPVPPDAPVVPQSPPVASSPPAPPPQPAPAAPARAPEPPPPESARRDRRGPGRFLSRGTEPPVAEEPRPVKSGFHAKVVSLRSGVPRAAGAAGLPTRLEDGLLSNEERRALHDPEPAGSLHDPAPGSLHDAASHDPAGVAGGGPGPERKPSIDPEILRSLEAARRGSASHETRLLEPRSPSRLGLEDEAPGEDRGRGPGRTTGKQKAAGGPAKRSRSRRGVPRAPREDAPAMETMAPEPAAPRGAGSLGTPGPPLAPAPADVSAPVEGLEPAAGPAPLETASLETPSLEVPPLDVPASDEATPHSVRARIVLIGRAGVSRIRARFRSGRVSILDHRVELKVSTIAAMALAGAILCVLVVTWLRLPPEEDAMLASFLPEPAPVAPGTEAAGGTGAGGSEAERGPGDSLRSLPLWSPSSAPPGESPRPPAAEPGPEIRNVEVVPAADADIELEAAPAGKEPAGGEEDAAPTAPGPAVHMIQVRAKESMEGARRILDYLALFGFEKSQVERDPRGAKNWEGKPLYTVFVGAYHDRAEADRECGRLKRVTRERPFRNREDFSDFFESALVITRTRR